MYCNTYILQYMLFLNKRWDQKSPKGTQYYKSCLLLIKLSALNKKKLYTYIYISLSHQASKV